MSSTTRTNSEPGRESGSRLARLFEHLPPQAPEAEVSLLGSMVIEPSVIGDILSVIRSAEDFHRPANGVIFKEIIDLYDRHASVDIVQLEQRLDDGGKLDEAGGLEYLVDLVESVPSAANAVHYARIVREKAVIRQLIIAVGEILHEAHHSTEDAQQVLGNAESRIFRIAQEIDRSQAEPLGTLIDRALQALEQSGGQPLTGLSTGFHDLDEVTCGLQKGEMIIIAARPSMGKTALALNMAEHIAVEGTPVGLFSLEMSRQQLVQRLLSSRSGVDSGRLRRAMLRKEDMHALQRACDDLHEAPIHIDDSAGLTLMQLRTKARRMSQKHGIGVVILDYLQLMSSGTRVDSRQQEVSDISRGVKAMARELNVPVICLSQLNRAAEHRPDRRPRMSDLRESGSIEQDADVVMMLHREAYYQDKEWCQANPDRADVAELIIAKQRNGPTGTRTLTWDESCTRFRSWAGTQMSVGTLGVPYDMNPVAEPTGVPGGDESSTGPPPF